MNGQKRSDLAAETLGERIEAQTDIEDTEEEKNGFRIRRLVLKSDDARERFGHERGTYLTFYLGKATSLEEEKCHNFSALLAEYLCKTAEKLTKKPIDGNFSVLVVGLGNAELTVDAIGPKSIGNLHPTRHLQEQMPSLFARMQSAKLSAIAPGVLGQTGIESGEIILGIAEKIHPDLILVIDALAARECAHLFSTLQLSDAGISPGSGVGNHRFELSERSLKIPVISLGIPTVVNSDILIREAMGESEPAKNASHNREPFFVAPSDSDFLVERFSDLIADAVRMAFTGGF